MIAFSPTLVREAAYRVGYRNMQVIKELQKMALLMELGRMNQLQAAVGGSGGQMPNNGNAGQTMIAQQTPPTAGAIQNQLKNQLVVQ